MNINNAFDLVHKGMLALSRVEQQGIRIDIEHAESEYNRLAGTIDKLTTEFEQTNFYRRWGHSTKGKINFNSDPQLERYLYNTRKIKPVKLTDSGKGSVDEEALKSLQIPELNILLRIRKLKKIKDTYLHQFIRESVDGYIHPSFNLHLVLSHRSSSDSPNFQNIPIRDEEAKKIIRTCLYPRPGHQLLEIDYSGIEFSINACYSADPVMVDYCKDPNSDIHADIAERVFLLDYDKSVPGHKRCRQAAKNGFVFPQLYGDYYGNCATNLACTWGELKEGSWKNGQGFELGERTLSDHLISKGFKSLEKYKHHIEECEIVFFKHFKVHQQYMKDTFSHYQNTGRIEYKTGFNCSGVMTRNQVLNYKVQGSAFHCLLWSLIEIDRIARKEKWRTRVIGQIHDSIVFDVYPPELDRVIEVTKRVTCMDLLKAWPWIIVPLRIDAELCEVDQSWYYKKEISI